MYTERSNDRILVCGGKRGRGWADDVICSLTGRLYAFVRDGEAVVGEEVDDFGDACDAVPGIVWDLCVGMRIYAVDIATGSGSGFALCLCGVEGDMHGDPDVAVEAEDHIDVLVGEVDKVALDSAHEGAGNGDEYAVAELAVAEGAGVEAGAAVCEDGLHLGDEEVVLGEEGAHLELVGLELAALHAAGEVDGREGQGGGDGGVHVYAPALGTDLYDTPDDEIADFRRVHGPHGADGEQLVGPLQHAGQGRGYRPTCAQIGPVPAHKEGR